MRDGYTGVSEIGLQYIFVEVHFTDGSDQTYLAIVHLQGDECKEHGWDDHPTDDTNAST